MRSKLSLIFWWSWPLLSGILLSLSFPLFEQSYLVWVTLIPLFIFLAHLQNPPHHAAGRSAWWGSFLTGFLFFGLTLRWFFDSWPLSWAGLPTTLTTFIIVLLVWLVTVLLMSALMGLFGLMVYKIGFGFKTGFVAAALWLVLEYVRSWIFILPWLGPEANFGPHWSLASLAYALHNWDYFLKLAPWFGTYGLGFLIVLANWNFFLLLKERLNFFREPKHILGFLTLLVILAGPFFVGWPQTHALGGKTVALIQTNFPALIGYGLGETEPTETKLISQALKEKPDIIILPEGGEWLSSLTKNFQLPPKETAQSILGNYPYLIVDHDRVQTEAGFKSRLFYFLNGTGVVATYDKELLVPNGEYLPYSVNWAAKLLNQQRLFHNFESQRRFTRGHKSALVKIGEMNIGGLICSGIISPELNRQLTNEGANFLLTVSSDAVFKGSELLVKQNLAMAQLRAAENQRYFVQVTNRGLSYIINENGHTQNITEKLGNTVLIGQIKLIETKSFYTRFGNWLVVFPLLIVIIYGFTRRVKPGPTRSS